MSKMDTPPTPLSSSALPARVIRLTEPGEVPGRLTELDLHAPRPVVVLVGGADGLDDDQLARLRPLFEEGLAPLADALGACVIDGGTDTGVMGLIGQARAKLGAGFPLIGVSATGTVAEADSPSLEPNHSHVVLVPGSKWGEESPWLAEIASQVAGDSPSVTVVVNGGEVTFQDAARSVEAGRPVLVVGGSGRTADTMAAALHEDSKDKRACRPSTLALARMPWPVPSPGSSPPARRCGPSPSPMRTR
jgi:SLOG in TRPM, prokaryote